ncbi:MAG TPA: hypothetical protein VJ301_17190, partial [Propionibacteriaceae bacterium]|nr:hypothetical protein [Propionibacteriaceae bacterium]
NMSLSRTVAWAGSRVLLLMTGLLPTIGFATLVALTATVTPAEGWPPLMFLTYSAWTVAIAIRSVGLSRHREPDLSDLLPRQDHALRATNLDAASAADEAQSK